MTEISQSPAPAARDEHALRIIFEYDGETVQLVSWQRVEMIIPLSDPVLGHTGEQGCWIELHDVKGRTLFRHVLSGGIRMDVEGPSDEPGYPMTRRPVERPKGVFVALVPDLLEAESISVWNSPVTAERAGLAAREVARFPLPKEGGTR